MYQQKFMPYNKMNEVYEDEEEGFEEEDSEPLIEEVDPDYEPTQKQVREYAIDVLGMTLPEDQRLLYLAREGLKAPMPPNWQPYQGRDGQVYYKHKITQEKTYEHPTDVQYQKRYIQQKQRAARKNLKSMNLKSNPLAGLGQSPFGQPAFGQPSLGPSSQLGLGSKFGMGMSNLSQQSSKEVSKLDPKLQEQLQTQLQELEARLKKEYEEFERERREQHQRNMKKYKTEFEASLSQLKRQESSISAYEKSLNEEKGRLKERLRQAYEDRLKDELGEMERKEEKKLEEYRQLYQQDNKIKLRKYQTQKQNEYQDRLNKVEKEEKKHAEAKKEKESERQRVVSSIKEELQQEDNSEIQQATKQAFSKELQQIKQSNREKVRQFQNKLQHEFQQMRKLLGHDPNQVLQEMAAKRNRLKNMSQQKLQAMKKKEYQRVAQSHSEQLQREMKALADKAEKQYDKDIVSHRQQCNQKLNLMKQRLQQQLSQKLQRQVHNVYQSVKKSTTQYQTSKTRKILQIREKFIEEIVEKEGSKGEQIKIRVSIRDKEDMIENKEQLVESLVRQLELERLVLRELSVGKRVAASSSVDQQLKKLLNEYNIVYKPQKFFYHEKRFNQLKAKYKSDKQLLASMMSHLQSNSMVGYLDPNHQSSASTTSLLIKQYNEDVRTMRRNEEMLGRYELALRKVQLNDQSALKEVESDGFGYEEISVRAGLGGRGASSNEGGLVELSDRNRQDGNSDKGAYPMSSVSVSSSYQSIQEKLKQHSRFLSNVKNELNRKLYQVRNNNYFRV